MRTLSTMNRLHLLISGIICLTCSLLTSSAWAQLNPESPEVKKAIDEGIFFLNQSDDNRLGAKALVGLTFAKYDPENKDHPKIKDGVEALINATKGGQENFNSDIYTTGISILFLVAVDPYKYRDQIEVLVHSLHRRQKAHGAWGYPENHKHGSTCDTSMTQYAALGMWEAYDQAGIETPPEVWDRLSEWFFRTQSPDGGFGYQGMPSPSLGQRIKQDNLKHSMAAAAMGSLYICKDQLGLSQLKKSGADDTPAELKPYESPEERQARLKTKLDPRFFSQAISLGNRWMRANYTIDKPKGWLHYYLYALERYESLQEADLERRSKNNSPAWYVQGARFLLKNQKQNGSWESQAKEVPDTCFAILFLLRSTKKSLEKSSLARFQASLQVGGRSIPRTTDVRLRDGNVVVTPSKGELDEILSKLSDSDQSANSAVLEAFADFAKSGDRNQLSKSSTPLGRLAYQGSPEVRKLAIQAISRSRNLELVPLLIHLLSDSDLEVMREARDALRVISRKFTGMGLGLRPTDEEREKAIEKWKEWYRTVRPDVDLEAIDEYASRE